MDKDYYNIEDGLSNFDFNGDGINGDDLDQKIAEIVYSVTHDGQKLFKTYEQQKLFLKSIEELKIKHIINKSELQSKFSQLRDNIISGTRKDLLNLDATISTIKKGYISSIGANIRDDITLDIIGKLDKEAEISYLDSPFTNQFKKVDGKNHEYVRIESGKYKGEYIPKEYILTSKQNIISRGGDSFDFILGIEISPRDKKSLTAIIQAEALGEGKIGMAAVAYSIINRIKHPAYPKTLHGVIFQKNQYSCVDDGGYKKALKDPNIIAKEVIESIFSGLIKNPIKNADSYCNPRDANDKRHKKLDKVCVIKQHHFFKTPNLK